VVKVFDDDEDEDEEGGAPRAYKRSCDSRIVCSSAIISGVTRARIGCNKSIICSFENGHDGGIEADVEQEMDLLFVKVAVE
jgi:hypothetical protein